MNYTQNHHLPQWTSSDRVRMEDFNDAMANIEAGITNSFSPSNLPFAAGSYKGQGTAFEVHLGFRPSMVIVSGIQQSDDYDNGHLEFSRYFGITSGHNIQDRLEITDDGFIVHMLGDNHVYLPNLNVHGRFYDYIAFR